MTTHQIDRLTRKLTSFNSFAALIDASVDYRPTLRSNMGREYRVLADAYDEAQAVRCDPRRAYRG